MLSVLRDLALRRHAVGDVPDGVWGPASVTLPVSSQTSKAGSEVSFSSAPCFKSLRRDFALSGVCSVPRGDPAPTWKPRCQQEVEGHFTKAVFVPVAQPRWRLHTFLPVVVPTPGSRVWEWREAQTSLVHVERRPASQAPGSGGLPDTPQITAWSPGSLLSTHPSLMTRLIVSRPRGLSAFQIVNLKINVLVCRKNPHVSGLPEFKPMFTSA